MGRHLNVMLTTAVALALMASVSSKPVRAVDLDPDLYLELWNTELAEPYDENWTMTDGRITYKNEKNQTTAEYIWTPPPKIIDAAGFSMKLSVSASATSVYYPFSAYMNANGTENPRGLRFEPGTEYDGASVSVEVNAGETKSNSVTATVHPEGNLVVGQRVYLSMSINNAGGGAGYRYFVKSRRATGAGQLSASINDCPATIMISAYPPLNCHITISGYRKNTADEVEVLFPSELDTFGNHANGIQLSGRGSMTVYAMHEEDPYSWGLFIFACPSQENMGANCYENVTVPGIPVTVPIIVRQANGGSVTVPLTFTPVPHD
jgi:hypothetical protein